MRVKSVISFLAVMLAALALVPAGAHLFELPNKLPLSQEQYFTVQSIYRGWALFGFVLCGSIAANFALAVTQRRQRKSFWFALLGFVLTSASLVIFLFWTYPTNHATTNWTAVPDNWRVLRRQWEYSHAAAAVSDFLGLCAVTVSILIGSD
jgi:hypothetical protein